MFKLIFENTFIFPQKTGLKIHLIFVCFGDNLIEISRAFFLGKINVHVLIFPRYILYVNL